MLIGAGKPNLVVDVIKQYLDGTKPMWRVLTVFYVFVWPEINCERKEDEFINLIICEAMIELCHTTVRRVHLYTIRVCALQTEVVTNQIEMTWRCMAREGAKRKI